MKKIGLLTFCMLLTGIMVFSQNKEEQAIATAVKKLNQAMIEGSQIQLDEIAADNLSYGHSNGLVEDKGTFIASIVDGKFGFTAIDLTEQTIAVSNNTAIVRHTFSAATDNKGQEPGTVKLHVMQVWQKDKGKWHLIGRQATKI
jgi:hypothetical protein